MVCLLLLHALMLLLLLVPLLLLLLSSSRSDGTKRLVLSTSIRPQRVEQTSAVFLLCRAGIADAGDAGVFLCAALVPLLVLLVPWCCCCCTSLTRLCPSHATTCFVG